MNYSFSKAVIAKWAGILCHSLVENLGKEFLPFIALQSVERRVVIGSQMPEKNDTCNNKFRLLGGFTLHFFNISFPNRERLNLGHFEIRKKVKYLEE